MAPAGSQGRLSPSASVSFPGRLPTGMLQCTATAQQTNSPQMDDDAEELLRRTAETIAEVPTSRPWKERIVLGGWNVSRLSFLASPYVPSHSTLTSAS